MKTIQIAFLLLFIVTCSYSQKMSFGINLGLNYTELKFDTDASLSSQIESIKTESRPGFHLGIHSVFKIANRVKIAPHALLDFSEFYYEIKDAGTDTTTPYSFDNVMIRLPIDIQLELLKGKNTLYLIGGIEYALNYGDEGEEPILAFKRSFTSGRLGVGFRKDLAKFSISPEIIFTKTLSSIEKDYNFQINQYITNLDNSVIGLNLKFQGLLSN